MSKNKRILKNYTILDYEKDDLYVKCNKCGRSFRIKLNAFIKDSYCRICEQDVHYKKLAINKIKKINYKFIRQEDKPEYVTVECKTCGYQFTKIISALNNESCEWCHPKKVGSKMGKKLYEAYGNNLFDYEEAKNKFGLNRMLYHCLEWDGLLGEKDNKLYIQFKPKNKNKFLKKEV